MTLMGWFQILLFLLVVLALTAPLGRFMTRVFTRERTWLDPVCRPIERLIYRATGVDETHEMRWTEYAVAMLLFSGVSMLLLYVMMRVQQWLPSNPQGFEGSHCWTRIITYSSSIDTPLKSSIATAYSVQRISCVSSTPVAR